jgi:pimeloyl-ACP methyl ester carboxylesterase
METVISKDGTALAFDRLGNGPALILMGGALNDRQQASDLAALLAPHFTVFNYDRRGRTDSGDTPPYAVSKEIDDLNAVIGVAGGSAMLFANCTGGMLAMEAVARGSAITKLALFEPPYIIGDARSPLPADFHSKVARLIDAGRLGDTVTYFLESGIGMPPEIVANVQHMEMWPLLESLAPTLLYDMTIGGDLSLPADRVRTVTVPTLVMDGGRSQPWLQAAVAALADVLPHATRQTVEGITHTIEAEAIAPVIRGFLAGPQRRARWSPLGRRRPQRSRGWIMSNLPGTGGRAGRRRPRS